MKHNVFIDGNSVGHAAQHGPGTKGKLYAGAQETTAIYGLLQSLRKIMKSRGHQTPIVLWDGRSWRYSEFDDYKGTRTDTADKVKERDRYRAQRKEMFLGLHLLGVRQLIAGNMEADDLAAIMTKRAVAKGEKVTLITGDKDWLQLVQPGVVWVDHKIDRRCNARDFHAFTGFRTTKAFVHGKGLGGDSGDNVKPNTGVGEDTAQKLFEVFECADDFLATPFDEAQALYKAHHGKSMYHGARKFHADTEAQERFRWALKMMDLNHPDIPKPTEVRATNASFDRTKFEAFCGRHAFLSILKDVDFFVKPFITCDQGDSE